MDGIIDVGEGVNETDALIGKVMVSGLSQKKTKQDTVYRDRSTLWQSFRTWYSGSSYDDFKYSQGRFT